MDRHELHASAELRKPELFNSLPALDVDLTRFFELAENVRFFFGGAPPGIGVGHSGNRVNPLNKVRGIFSRANRAVPAKNINWACLRECIVNVKGMNRARRVSPKRVPSAALHVNLPVEGCGPA